MARSKPELKRPSIVPTPPATPAATDNIGCMSVGQLEGLLHADHVEPRRLWLAIAALHPNLIASVYQAILRYSMNSLRCHEALFELIEMVPAASAQGLAIWRQAWPQDRTTWPQWVEVLMGVGRREPSWNADLILSIVRKITTLEQECNNSEEWLEEEGSQNMLSILDGMMVVGITLVSSQDLEALLNAFELCILPCTSRSAQWLIWPLITMQREAMDRWLGFLIKLAWTTQSNHALDYISPQSINDTVLIDACLSCLYCLLPRSFSTVISLIPKATDPTHWLPQLPTTASATEESWNAYSNWCKERDLPLSTTAVKIVKARDPWSMPTHLPRLHQLLEQLL